MSGSDHFDAVVIGAGPAGSAAAILLARAGWKVALVEKQRFPRRKVCGECIAASNLPLLEALGIGAEVERLAGAPLEQVALLRGGRRIVAPLPPADQPRHPYGRALGREELDTLLVARASQVGVTVLQPASLQVIAGEPGDFHCLVRGADGDRELHARIVVAAHGSWEPLPFERAERRKERKPSDLFAFKANFTGSSVPAGLLPVLAFDGGYGGMVVADHGLTTLACCVREERLAALRLHHPGQPAGEAVEHYLLEQCSGVASMLEGASRQGVWLASGPLRPGIRVGAGGQGVFLIGNAAGEAHPIVGEGISMALQSAFLLAGTLLPEAAALLHAGSKQSAAVQQRLLHEHAAAWRRHFARRLRVAATFAHVAMRPALSAPLWPLLRAWPGLLTRGARWSGKTRSVAAPSSVPWLAAT